MFQALGAVDYLYIAQVFHTVIIRQLPQMHLKMKSPVRRFITLIDTLYDNRTRVVVSADVPIEQLFIKDKPDDIYQSDEHRMLMDDLKISKDSVSYSLNLYFSNHPLSIIQMPNGHHCYH